MDQTVVRIMLRFMVRFTVTVKVMVHGTNSLPHIQLLVRIYRLGQTWLVA